MDYSFIQFPGISPEDINVAINGLQATSSNSSIDDLVDTNPQFFYLFGNSGNNTLCSFIQVNGIDITITTGTGSAVKSVKGIPVQPHHAPRLL